MTTESHDPGGLIVGDYPIMIRHVTLVSGQNQPRGAVLGKITTGGKYALSLSGAVDGSETPKAVLAEAADASGGDLTVPVYVSGEFANDKITYGADHTAATVNAAFEAVDAPMAVRTRV